MTVPWLVGTSFLLPSAAYISRLLIAPLSGVGHDSTSGVVSREAEVVNTEKEQQQQQIQ